MKRKKKYSGAVLIADNRACDAAWALTKLRLLAADVPPLPSRIVIALRPASAGISTSTIGVGLSDSIRDRRPLQGWRQIDRLSPELGLVPSSLLFFWARPTHLPNIRVGLALAQIPARLLRKLSVVVADAVEVLFLELFQIEQSQVSAFD